MAPPRKKRGVLQRRREARLLKMIAGTLVQNFEEGLRILGLCIVRLFAMYLAIRQGKVEGSKDHVQFLSAVRWKTT